MLINIKILQPNWIMDYKANKLMNFRCKTWDKWLDLSSLEMTKWVIKEMMVTLIKTKIQQIITHSYSLTIHNFIMNNYIQMRFKRKRILKWTTNLTIIIQKTNFNKINNIDNMMK